MKIAKIGIAAAAALLASACGGGADDAAEAPAAGEAASAETAAPAADAGPAQANVPSEPPLAFAQCRSCHAVEQGKHGIGPSLFGMVGAKAASVEGFNYSPALKESGITWDRESLDTWLQAPMKMVPGTRMVIGLPNAEARSAIIDYMETLK